MKIVMKFGGAGLANGDLFSKVTEIISETYKSGNEVIVVVSAMESVTDSLIEIGQKAQEGEFVEIAKFCDKLGARHFKAMSKCVRTSMIPATKQNIRDLLSLLERFLTGIAYVREMTARSKDMLMSFGERLSAQLIVGALRSMGYDVEYLTGLEAGIVTDDNFGNARPFLDVTEENIQKNLVPLLNKAIVVVTGFVAGTMDGAITTLGRGGSDYTAGIIGSGANADEIWFWKDVDGVMTCDPNIDESISSTIPELSFAEATELAYFGAKILHPKTIEPAMEKNIKVRVKNLFNPHAPDTVIVKHATHEHQQPQVIHAIGVIQDVALVTVGGASMIGVPGIVSKVFGAVEKENINVIMISQSSSQANLSFVVQKEDLKKVERAIKKTFTYQNSIEIKETEDDVSVMAVVGEGMRGTPGTAARVFSSCGAAGVNIRMISQGSSELNISFVIKEEDVPLAVKAIHEEFGLGKINANSS